MTFSLLYLPIALLFISSINGDVSLRRSIRQTSGTCPNPGFVEICNFVVCENDGLCTQDVNSPNCFKCNCPTGFTGQVCETPVTITVGCAPGCQNGGVCTANVCNCPSGFTGVLCEVRDYCAPTNPCRNGGRCQSTGASFVCDCTSTGFTGPTCSDSISVDLCASRPCQNGGSCSSNGASITCTCVAGFAGSYCQIAPAPCGITPCENGGTCQTTATQTAVCVCPPEWTGPRCETSILPTHPCVTMPDRVCLNNGVCTVNGVGYVCKCATGWTGANCEIKTSGPTSCTPNPCGANGVCIPVALPTGPGVVCNCADRWTGRYCDVNMDDNCPAGFCLNGGTCRMNANVPVCSCLTSFTGVRCESAISSVTTTLSPGITTTTIAGNDPCSMFPCRNNGTCFRNGNDFLCACQLQWTGRTCEQYNGPTTTPGNSACASNPCRNSGTCYRYQNSYVCVCKAPFAGPTCETVQTTTPSVANACASAPCRNGATCYGTATGYLCYCGANSNLTGKNCESTINGPNCPLNCNSGVCILSGNVNQPYACNCNGVISSTACPRK